MGESHRERKRANKNIGAVHETAHTNIEYMADGDTFKHTEIEPF